MTTPDDEDALAHTRMSFGEHLEELRSRVGKGLLCALLGLVLVFIKHEQVMEIVTRPFREVMTDLNKDPALTTFGVAEGFFAYLKVSLVVGLILTAPFWIYQIWAFIAAGMYENERNSVRKYVPLCVLLFVSGILFGYFLLIPMGLNYLLTFSDPTVITTTIGIKQYLGLFTVLTLVLGATFQLPVVMIGLVRAGITTTAALRAKRRWVILIIFIAAAVLTPPDPVTQCLLAVPLLFLYELGLYASWLSLGKSRPPIDWRAAWPRLRNVLIVLLVLVLLRDPLLRAWDAQKSEERLWSKNSGGHDIRASVARLLKVPASTVGPIYRVDEEGDTAWFVVSTSSPKDLTAEAPPTVRVLTVRRERKTSLILDEDPGHEDGPRITEGVFPRGTTVFVGSFESSVPYSRFLPEVLRGFDVGGDKVKAALRPLLVAITGESCEGEDDESALETFEAWAQTHADEHFKQKP